MPVADYSTTVSSPHFQCVSIFGQEEPLNFDLNTLPNSQDLGTLWIETHGLYGITWDALTKLRRRPGERVLPIEIDESEALDINTPVDYEETVKHYEERTQRTV